MKVSDFEKRIDKEYSCDSIKQITRRGITLSDCELLFEDCRQFYHGEIDFLKRYYVADRNVLADPKYLRFTVDGLVYIVLFPTTKALYQTINKIDEVGYTTFDAT